MKTNSLYSSRRECGIMLVDCLVYIAVFFMILGVAFKMFYSCWDSAKTFRRNSDQIAATLKTGERWREDVRRATATPRAEESSEGTVLRIPQKTSEVDYRFFDGELWRRDGNAGEWTPLLLKVKSSRMEQDKREHVAAWRWEVELATRRKGAKVVPLFTFEAVPQRVD
ncbi:MAG TPA: hypothetical protein VG754_08140 [Verrucomicrobiae bacterium]|nr:hypothetical protein [Verrucomicrobiae bacterium]